ncbi:MAG: hypothetical protein IT306_14165 [Chloroflexi bacterium]|nr:hypothetical protein [Chloroflexota bacterium]
MRSFLLAAAASVVGPVLFGLAVAGRLFPGDWFWIVTPFGLLPLTGVAAGFAVRAAGGRPRPILAALGVPCGIAVGWIVGLLVTLPLDPGQETAMTLFFALLSTFALPWWLLPLAIGMALSWAIARGGWRRDPGYV